MTTTPRSLIAATGSYLPERVVTNDDLAAFLDTSDAWIRDRTGIGARHVAADDEVTSDLAAAASRRALEAAGVSAASLDMIVTATVTPDSPMPACAVRLQHKLGAGKVPAFDVSAACAGFLFGLTIADQFIRAGGARRVLVVGVELLSRIIDWSDRTTAVLFGDGAGAVLVERAEPGDPRGIEACRIHSDGSLAAALEIPAGGSAEPATERGLAARRNKVHMLGQDVFRAAVRGMTDVGQEVVAAAGLTLNDVDRFVPHQANLRILQALAERWAVPLERFVLVLDETGNTSSASIPIALDRGLSDGRLCRGQRVLMSALGAGVSYGAVLARL
ncbi:MAG: ketoacyl-ACP synthase III [Polyangiaceae bacterium]|nr:ketoacyl-ACP synthase III [Polyangiaceae bacterium]